MLIVDALSPLRATLRKASGLGLGLRLGFGFGLEFGFGFGLGLGLGLGLGSNPNPNPNQYVEAWGFRARDVDTLQETHTLAPTSNP